MPTQDRNAPQNLSGSPNSAQQDNPTGTNEIAITIGRSENDTPRNPSDESPPHEDTKLGFTAFCIELVGAQINLAVSPGAKRNQALNNAVAAALTVAFFISSTALLLQKKRPADAKKMQKAAFLIGTFGFLGIIGMLLPASFSWWFTISGFLVFLLIFAFTTLIT